TSESRVTFRTRAPLRPGDLIRFDDPAGSGMGQTFATVDRGVTTANGGPSPQQIDATICAAFEVPGGLSTSPPVRAAGTAEVARVTGPVAATLAIDGASGADASMHFAAAVPPTLTEGQWVRWSDGGPAVWLRIGALSRRPSASDVTLADTVVVGPAWREIPTPMSPPSAPDRASILTLDLRVSRDQSNAFRLDGVGLTPSHRSSWWRQVSDDIYYVSRSGELAPASEATAQAARNFPL